YPSGTSRNRHAKIPRRSFEAARPWVRSHVGHVNTATRKAKAKRLRTVKQELAKIAAKRTALWQLHEERSDAAVALEISRLSEQIEGFWEESRTLTAEIRNGARAEIIARARAAERIERDLGPRSRSRPAARTAS